MLYKSNKNRMEDKEVADIVTLIETRAEPFAPANVAPRRR